MPLTTAAHSHPSAEDNPPQAQDKAAPGANPPADAAQTANQAHADRAGHGQMAMEHEHAGHASDHEHAPVKSAEHSGHEHMAIGHDRTATGGSAEHAGHEQMSMEHDHTAMGGGGEHAGHGGAHADHTGHEQLFRRKFWYSLLLSIPVLVFSTSVQSLLGYRIPAFPGSAWITPVFAAVVFLYGGLPFLKMAVPELKNRQPGMMMLISLAITVSFVYSLATLFLPGQMDFFWELVTLIDIMLLGHWIEMRSVRQASGALDALAKLMPDTAERLAPDGSLETVPAARLAAGDLLLVRPGAAVPADGEVVEGESSVNESMITGESKPVAKAPGSRVIGGAVNGDGSLRVRVTATGDATALAGIMRLVAQAESSKSRTQVLADTAAGWLFYIAVGVAVITAAAWIIAIGFNVRVIERVATVLVIACPHALGLAVPLVVAITTGLGARSGILVRKRLDLEKMRLVDMVVFDKTGTLTEGRFGVAAVQPAAGRDADAMLALTAAAEGDSEHTIARAIRESAQAKGLTIPAVSGFEALKGRGVTAHTAEGMVYVGGPRLLESLHLALPDDLARFERAASERGQSVVHLVLSPHSGENAAVAASLALADVIRPESREAVRQLQENGLQVAMLTGDSQAVAKAVAEELNIKTWFAEVLPENKDSQVAELQRQGHRVAMVGDGINDAPALTRADVGIAIGSGTDVAVESAGIILVRSNPLDIVKIVKLSRASYRKMVQNLAWAAGYNVVALPLAAGVLAPLGILLSPAVGALLMSLSTVIVALNAQLLRRVKL
ncbi:MAG: copper-translocating P-type ATPase [Anaerolineae bacterium]